MRYCPIALVVSVDRQVRQLVAVSLGELGCATCDAATREEGLTYAARMSLDVVVVDVCQPDAVGSDLIRELRVSQPNLKVLYLIGPAHSVFRSGIPKAHDSYLRKPFRLDELCDIVSSWLEDGVMLPGVTGVAMN